MRASPLPFLSLALALLLASDPAGAAAAPSAPRLAAAAGTGALSSRPSARSCRATRQIVRRARRTLRSRPQIPWLRGNLPNVQAQGALVLDLEEGEELFARRADEPRPIASISKLAAALTVVGRGLDLDGLTTVARDDLAAARGGARSRLSEGMILTNNDLLHAALLGSDNRAVSALGRAVSLDGHALAEAMTATARDLGLRETSFVEPTGLSPQNRSTPREIIGLLRAVMDHPVLGPITRKVQHEVRPVGRHPIHYVNTHRPASRPNTFVLGGKTGFNNAARYCLVLAARVGGRTLGMAFLGTEGELTRFGDVARVSDWVVARRARPVDGLPVPSSSPFVPQTLPASGALEIVPAPTGDVGVDPPVLLLPPSPAQTSEEAPEPI